MAKIKQPVIRVSPFDIPLELYQLADSARLKAERTWKDFLTEGIRLVLAREAASQPGGTEEV